MIFCPPTQRGLRGTDGCGDGSFGAPRGDRLHRGLDVLAEPGDAIHAACSGTVTKLGFCYADDLSYRYVQITHNTLPIVARLLYVLPDVDVGQAVAIGDVVGTAQDIAKRYGNGMKNHCHLELQAVDNAVLMGKGHRIGAEAWVNPCLLLEA